MGGIIFIKCTICEANITSVPMHIVPKWDNLEKNMGKW